MDFEILPQLIIVISVAGILTIFGRNFSKVKEASEEIFLQESLKEKKEKEKFIYLYKRALRRINRENYQKKMAEFMVWLEKFLRKVRISFLKLDGKMVTLLEHLRKHNIESIEMFKETERSFRKNMEKESENFSKFWNVKKPEAAHGLGFENKQEAEEIKTQTGEKALETENIIEVEETIEIIQPSYESENIENYAEKVEQEKTGGGIETEDAANKEAIESSGSVLQEEMQDNMIEADLAEIEEIKEVEEDEKEYSEDGGKIKTKKEKEYIEMLMNNPADIKAYWKLGLIYSKRRNYEDALACFRQIIKIDPTYTKAKQKAIELMEKMRGKGK